MRARNKRCPNERKEAVLKKMLPPGKAIQELAQEEGILEATLNILLLRFGQRSPEGGMQDVQVIIVIIAW